MVIAHHLFPKINSIGLLSKTDALRHISTYNNNKSVLESNSHGVTVYYGFHGQQLWDISHLIKEYYV